MGVLLVEDSPIQRNITKDLLLEMGFDNVILAKDGLEALEKMYTHKIDIVITDLNMPKMTGLELAKAIRIDSNLKHIPILVVTARNDEENILKALNLHVEGYIVKPFSPQMFAKKVFAIIKGTK